MIDAGARPGEWGACKFVVGRRCQASRFPAQSGPYFTLERPRGAKARAWAPARVIAAAGLANNRKSADRLGHPALETLHASAAYRALNGAR